jgi:hypothetical protein
MSPGFQNVGQHFTLKRAPGRLAMSRVGPPSEVISP